MKKGKKVVKILPEVGKVKLRLTMGQYQFIECDLPQITTMSSLLDFVKTTKRKELEERFTCEHMFYQQNTSKAGKAYRTCFNCGSQSYENPGKFADGKVQPATWSQWKVPVKYESKEAI